MSKALFEDSPMMKAVRCQPAQSVPVWCMRQAGRYMPEYQKVRKNHTFSELCKNPELAAEVMLTAVKVLGVDAAILFSDILLLLEPMGLSLDYVPDEGPAVSPPVREPEDVKRIHELESPEQLKYIIDAVRYTREGLAPDIPLIGFTGAPFTLASYAVEGGGSKNFRQVKAFMHLYPDDWQKLMKMLAVSAARLLNAQIDAGVQIVQIFDSWAGCLSKEDYQKFVQPYSKMLIDLIHPGTPIIHFAPGNPVLLPSVRDAGGHVIGVDWRISIDAAWNEIGTDYAVQGNLDPAILLTNKEIIKQHVKHILRILESRPGFIFNLGHGIMPQTPVENVITMIETVHEFGQNKR